MLDDSHTHTQKITIAKMSEILQSTGSRQQHMQWQELIDTTVTQPHGDLLSVSYTGYDN